MSRTSTGELDSSTKVTGVQLKRRYPIKKEKHIMTATTFYSNNSFSSWAMKHLSIDETDDSQVLVHVPCQDGRWYHVTCLESKTNITPANCSCGRDHCKHQAVVTA